MAEAAGKSMALWVVRRLRKAGYQALLAGGCVRDMLLGRRCTDYDVATDATPRQVKRLFRHVLLVGAKFGVAMVIRDGRKVEVATFRSDLSYEDGRRPTGVRFASPGEDALRRDFTINGMFYDPVAGEVIDHVGGRRDLARRVVRTIGDPDLRFAEDYLRMIRAVRFAVRLGFTIAPPTRSAIRRHAPRIAAISGERVFDELSKMLAQPTAAEALKELAELELARHVLGELLAGPGLWPAAVARVAAVARRGDLALTLAALLMDLPPASIGGMVRRWGAPNELRDGLLWLAAHRDGWRTAPEMPLAAFRKMAGHRQFQRLAVLWRVRERLETGREVFSRRVGRRLKQFPGGHALPKPLLKGADLIEMGMNPGEAVGKLLREAYDAQLELVLRTRREALDFARQRMLKREEE